LKIIDYFEERKGRNFFLLSVQKLMLRCLWTKRIAVKKTVLHAAFTTSGNKNRDLFFNRVEEVKKMTTLLEGTLNSQCFLDLRPQERRGSFAMLWSKRIHT